MLMKVNGKRLLALLLTVCSLVSLLVPGVSAAETDAQQEAPVQETYEFPEFGEPVDMGEVMRGGMSIDNGLELLTHEGQNYLCTPVKGSGFYVFKLSEFLTGNQSNATWMYDSENTSIQHPRTCVKNSQNIVYVGGDTSSLFIYDFEKATGRTISSPLSYIRTMTVDENDNIYLGGEPLSDSDVFTVYKLTPDEQFVPVYVSNELKDTYAMVYGDGCLYIWAILSDGVSYTIHKVDVATGKKLGETPMPLIGYYISYVNGIVFPSHSNYTKYGGYFIDANTMEFIDLGIKDNTMGYVTTPVDGKSYINIYSKGLHELDWETRTLTMIPGTIGFDYYLRLRDGYPIDRPGCILTQITSEAGVYLLDCVNGGYTLLEGFVDEGSSPASLKSLCSGIEGHEDVLYVGGFLTPRVISYRPSAKNEEDRINMEAFSNTQAQTDKMIIYKDKIYCGVYSGAWLVEYDPKTDEVINYGSVGEEQSRMHALAAGDDKIFFGTIPKPFLKGGSLGWYDLKTGEWVVMRNIVQDHSIIGVVYDEETKLLYACTSLSGGQNSPPSPEGSEAMMVVYDVEARKHLGTFSVRAGANPNSDMKFDLENGDLLPTYIGGIAQDPNTGKFWGVLGYTLFSFSYNREKNTLSIHEEWERETGGKYRYATSSSLAWNSRPFIFDDKNQLYIYFDTMGIVKFNLETMEYVTVTKNCNHQYAIGTDGNLYSYSGTHLWRVPLTHVGIVEGMIANITVDERSEIATALLAYNSLTKEEQEKFDPLALEKLDSLILASDLYEEAKAEKTVDLISNLKAITAGSEGELVVARQNYEAINDDFKKLVTNYQDLVTAEEKYKEICGKTAYLENTNLFIDFSTAGNPNMRGIEFLDVTYDHTAGGTWCFGDTNGGRTSMHFGAGALEMKMGGTTTYYCAVKVRFPQPGVYTIDMETTNFKGCYLGVYLFPVHMPLKEGSQERPHPAHDELMQSKANSGHYVGTVDSTIEGTSHLAQWNCPSAGEYYMTFVVMAPKDGTYARVKNMSLSLQNPQLDNAVEMVKEKINDIGKVTLKSEKKIQAARLAYNSLTASQREIIYAPGLELAEAKFQELKEANDAKVLADNTVALQVKIIIDSVGEVLDLTAKPAVEAARAAYNALTADQKKLVINLHLLEEAELAVARLEKAEANKTPVLTIVLIVVGSVVVLAAAAVTTVLIIKKNKAKSAEAVTEEAAEEVTEETAEEAVQEITE